MPGPSARRAALALTGALLTLALPVAAQESTTQFWPELDAYVRLSPFARLFFLSAPVREPGEGLQEASIGANVEVGLQPIARRAFRRLSYDEDRLRFLRLRVGVARTFSLGGSPKLSERRVIGEVTGRAFLPLNVLAALRNRLDLRWIEGEYSWRYRPRLWLERESRVGRVTLVPYASAEVFYDSRFDTWNRTYYQIGMAVPAVKWLVPEAYYALQKDREPTASTIHALGLVATLYF